MNIVIRSANKKYEDIIPDQVKFALDFIKIRYPHVDFSKLRFIFGKGRRSRYFRNSYKEEPPTVFIAVRSKWATYELKTLKVFADWIFVGCEKEMLFALVHELTHHVQFELGFSIGEKLTTKNELEFCEEFFPQYLNKLTVIQ